PELGASDVGALPAICARSPGVAARERLRPSPAWDPEGRGSALARPVRGVRTFDPTRRDVRPPRRTTTMAASRKFLALSFVLSLVGCRHETHVREDPGRFVVTSPLRE